MCQIENTLKQAGIPVFGRSQKRVVYYIHIKPDASFENYILSIHESALPVYVTVRQRAGLSRGKKFVVKV